METIKIEVQGQELEVITVELSQEEVKAIYNERKELKAKAEELTKKLESVESNYKYSQEQRNKFEKQVDEVHALLDALQVDKKTNYEDAWRNTDLSLATRLAVYFATKG